jgi:DNA-binding response OmpR family regulator
MLLLIDPDGVEGLLAVVLGNVGYVVKVLDGVPAATQVLQTTVCDLLIVSGRNILDDVRGVREAGFEVPIMVLSSRDDEIDEVASLEAGADDYMRHPVRVAAFLARVQAQIRRSKSSAPFNAVRLDREGHAARVGSRRVDLTRIEYKLLAYLLDNAGRAISRRELLKHVWDQKDTREVGKTVDMHVSRLRQKIGPEFIATVRDQGYMFKRSG